MALEQMNLAVALQNPILNGETNFFALQQHVRKLEGDHVTHSVIRSNTGCGPSVSFQDGLKQYRSCRKATEKMSYGVNITPPTSGATPAQIVEFAKACVGCGTRLDFFLLQPPLQEPGMAHRDTTEATNRLRIVLRALKDGGLKIPILLYDYAKIEYGKLRQVPMDAGVVEVLRPDFPDLVGLKYTNDDVTKLESYLKIPEFFVYTGHPALTLVGQQKEKKAKGVISGEAGIDPKWFMRVLQERGEPAVGQFYIDIITNALKSIGGHPVAAMQLILSQKHEGYPADTLWPDAELPDVKSGVLLAQALFKCLDAV